jgi:hypothetical protein
MANNGLPCHVAGTSALPLTADIRVPKSAFWRNTSASPLKADVAAGGSESPQLTQPGHLLSQTLGIINIVQYLKYSQLGQYSRAGGHDRSCFHQNTKQELEHV